MDVRILVGTMSCMVRRRNNERTPMTHGWVYIVDMARQPIECIDCSSGGAQQALEKTYERYAADGWMLEGRTFDFQFAHKGDKRIEIGIAKINPTKPPPDELLTDRWFGASKKPKPSTIVPFGRR